MPSTTFSLLAAEYYRKRLVILWCSRMRTEHTCASCLCLSGDKTAAMANIALLLGSNCIYENHYPECVLILSYQTEVGHRSSPGYSSRPIQTDDRFIQVKTFVWKIIIRQTVWYVTPWLISCWCCSFMMTQNTKKPHNMFSVRDTSLALWPKGDLSQSCCYSRYCHRCTGVCLQQDQASHYWESQETAIQVKIRGGKLREGS